MNISVSHIFLSENSAISLQMRLRETISAAIWSGRFAPGDKLPSTRALAQHLKIARITVSAAYQELVADGYLVSAPRSGYRISETSPNLRLAAGEKAREEAVKVEWSRHLPPTYAAMAEQVKPANWRAYRYPFVYGQADQNLFPHDAWRDCARRALGKRDFDAAAGDFRVADDSMLVKQIVMRSLPGRGVAARPEEILVTLGAQNALWIVAHLLMSHRPDAFAAMEEPGYPELREILRLSGVRVAPIPLDKEGMLVDEIPEGVQVVFITPSHHAPTGINMSRARRQRLLELAEERDFIVVEDDYDYEMNYLKPPLPALKSIDSQDRVIYLGSFSKTLFPGLRLGYIAAAETLITEARGLRTLVTRHPPGITQRATAYFLALGHYNAHAARQREVFKARWLVLEEALAATDLKVVNRDTIGGASVWLEFPAGIDSDALAEELKNDSVLIEPGARFFASANPPRNFARLAYSVIPKDRIGQGVKLIADAIGRWRG